MEQKIDNQLTNCNMEKYIGGNEIINYNITMYQESERQFIVTYNVNTKPVSYFTGRETELQDLRKLVETGQKSVLVSGMGGIGKTNICRKLFDEYKSVGECGFFRHIGYIEYNGNMESSLQNCLFYKKQENPEANKEAAWKELEYLAADGKLLLFVDNVNVTMREDEGLKRLKNIPGAVVLTSRRTSFSKEFKTFNIGFLDIEQCKTVYEKIRYEDSDIKVPEEEIPDLEYIIEKLAAKHTITIEFLAHLAQKKHWTVKKLRGELEEKGFQLEYKDEEDKLINIQEEYEKLYDLSELTEAEKNILEAFSVFPYIPLAAETCNQWLLADAGSSEDDDVLIGLYRKGWLQFDMNQESYRLHPVFAKFIYERQKPKSEMHRGLIEACQKCLEIPESGSALEFQKFLPFAQCILEQISMESEIERVSLMDELACLLQYMGEYTRAEILYKKSLQTKKNLYGEEHLLTADSYNNLAEVYKDQGKYKEAEGLYREALLIRENMLGKEHLDTADSYNRLASVYNARGKYIEAERLYIKALLIREKMLGRCHSSTASIYNNLAGLYCKQGRCREAERLYKKALLTKEKMLGEKHLDTASIYNNLAGLYCEQGKYIEAERLYKKALLIKGKALGEKHPDIASIYNNLAVIYAEQKKYKEAEELHKKALLIRRCVLGEYHPSTADSYNNLAGVYYEQKNYREAERLFKKALLIKEKVLEEEHPDIADSYYNLAIVYIKQGKCREAEEMDKKALLIREKVFGEEHPETTDSYNNLARIFAGQEKYEKAEEFHKKALSVREKVPRGEYPDITYSYDSLAEINEIREEYKEAEKLYRKSLQIRMKVLGEEHPDTVLSYHNLASLVGNQGKFRKAEKLYKKTIQIGERVMGKEHSFMAISYNNLAGVYIEQGKIDMAIMYYCMAYKVFANKFGGDDPNTQFVSDNLEAIFREYNPEGNFEQWLEEQVKE